MSKRVCKKEEERRRGVGCVWEGLGWLCSARRIYVICYMLQDIFILKEVEAPYFTANKRMFDLKLIVRSSGSGSGMLRWEKEPFVIIPGKN